jgi:hypothetical protein
VDASCYDACVAKGESPSACDAFCFKASDAGVDKACYDSCIAKGAPPSTCEAYCSGGTGGKPGTGGTSGSGGSSAGGGGTAGAGTGGSSTGGSGGVGGVPDPAIEKPCIQCLNDPSQGGGVCAAEANACLASLACSQLEWCPTLCGKPNCLPECNSIIPTGVAPLTALVKCMACGNGPCANACKGALVLSYCN